MLIFRFILDVPMKHVGPADVTYKTDKGSGEATGMWYNKGIQRQGAA